MPIQSTTLRLIQKNPNGFHTRHNMTCTKLTNGLQDMMDLDAGVILFNETNTDWQNYDLREEYNHRIKKHWSVNRTQFSSSQARADNEYLPGGTATTILGKWVGRVLQSTEDPTNMGR